MDRRYFLKTSGIGLASFGLMAAAPNFLHQFASAANLAEGYAKKKVLVTIFQRGAVDGLNDGGAVRRPGLLQVASDHR